MKQNVIVVPLLCLGLGEYGNDGRRGGAGG